ncbi:hypothetical protein KL949_005087 [Ogataea haglerorum]|nr:hypothetical protein KL913_005049 [Ogataea haglerorum]KAG7713924.1 hypothetical protein KL949_005087 [Ogataea haglerorum]
MAPRHARPREITSQPAYKFPTLYAAPYECMFPVVATKPELLSKDGIDFTASVRFEPNNVQKYSQPINIKYTVSSSAQKASRDPLKRVFAHYEEDRVSGLAFGVSTITCGPDGRVSVERSAAIFPDTPVGSKRSLDSLDVSFGTTTPSPVVVQRLGSLKKRRHDRLDNSMTISQRAILRMVDDSLVSSDTELYTSILQEVRPQTSNVRASRTENEAAKETVSIDAEDLKLALSERALTPLNLGVFRDE